MTSESKTPTKKRIRVAAALIHDGTKIFLAQRDYGFLKGKWEFPGGKIESGETPERALVREIKEELDTTISVDSFFMNIVYEYPDFIIDMDAFNCHIKSGELEVEKGIHSAEAWKEIKDLNKEDWCPADRLIVEKLTDKNTKQSIS
ncbi:MAG: (deoxy)nucleoside triphosphate pyrophosphohydrolase [Bacilli bacterium]|jgi:8-oxo-dGTP diphosphatase|nr:(deoxy)nucleoside triphosphate pyrophosphohydrolase [Bacilli bacterium]